MKQSCVVFHFLLVLFLVSNSHAEASFRNPSDTTDVRNAILTGAKLDAAEARNLERILAGNSDDLMARTKLLAYYFRNGSASAEASQYHQKHVFWIIKNRPDAGIAGLPECRINPAASKEGYAQAKQLWMEHIQSHLQDVRVLDNAAKFFFASEKELAEECLKQAQKLEPNNPLWSERLGSLYKLQGKYAQSLAEFEKAQRDDTCNLTRFFRLTELTRTAFESGEIEKARQDADQLLQEIKRFPTNWNVGNAIHYAHSVLGCIALKKGDVAGAKEHLLQSGAVRWSPQLSSVGPSMVLAKELLQKGEKETVLKYFRFCNGFWDSKGHRLEEWTEQVKSGAIPQFDPELL
jgi:tetratricopeptide (TPR) repeat protein